jgi:hypothetical protein
MLMLVTIAVWIVLVFSLQVSLFGNPTYTLVTRAPQSLVEKAGVCLMEETAPEDDETREFLARFARWSIASVVLICVEVAVTIYFILAHPLFIVPWMIVAKYIVLIQFALGIEWEEETSILDQIARMPQSLIHMERFVCFLTAIGFVALLLKLLQGEPQ